MPRLVWLALSAACLAGPAAAQDYPALVTQLAADDYRERERAGAALLKAGEAAIPQLKAALLKAADPEAARRLEVILERLESTRLGEPRRVTFKADRTPAKEVFAELTRQTGYKFRFDAPPEKALVTFDWKGTPFLQALDQLCDALDLTPAVQNGDGLVALSAGDEVNPHTAYAGPFRVVATQVQSGHNLQIGGYSRRNPLARPPDYVNVTLSVSGEPKACLCATGEPQVLRAVDELKNSLVIADPAAPPGAEPLELPTAAYRSFQGSASFGVNRAARRAEVIRECRVRMTVAVLAEARPEIVVTDVAKAKGKKFTGRDHLLEVVSTGEQGAAAVVTVTVSRKNPNPDDRTWSSLISSHFEAYDADGKALAFNGLLNQDMEANRVTVSLMYGRPTPGRKPPAIARLQLVEWVVQHKPIEFTLTDIPLP